MIPGATVPWAEAACMVSPLCLGTMMFGDRTDEQQAREIVAIARDAGVNFIDTADAYSLGRVGADHRPPDRRRHAITGSWRPRRPTR